MHVRAEANWLKGAWLLVVLFSWYTTFSLPLFDEDEGEYAEVAVEMAHSGDYITPTLNGQAFYEKPILAFWLQAPLVRLLGVHAGVFRLPSLLACLLWSWLLWRFAREQENAAHPGGWLAAFFCLTSLGVVVSAEAAAMEGVLSLLVSAACLDIYRFWRSASPWARRRVYVWMALGFLAKGPIAVLIPLLVSLIFFASQGKLASWLKALADPLGWLLFAGVALPWYLLQYHLMGQSFLDYFLFRENLGRLTGTLQGHGGSYGYYLPVLLLIVLPHTTLMLRAGWNSLRQPRTALTLFLWIWLGVVLGVFTLASTKLPHYLLVGLSPVFLLMARHREALDPGPAEHDSGSTPTIPVAESRRPAKTLAWALTLLPWLLMAALTLSLPAWVAHQAAQISNPYLQEMLQRGPEVFDEGYWGRAILILGGSMLLMWLLWRRVPGAPCWYWLVLAGLASNALVGGCWLPAAAALQQQPVLEAAHLARSLPVATPLVADNRMPSFAVYSGRPTQNRPPRAGDVLFLRADRVAQLPPHETLYARGGLRLVRILAH